MDKTVLFLSIDNLIKSAQDLYDLADEFHDEASDKEGLNILGIANDLSDIVDFLSEKLPYGYPRPAPPRKPNVTPFKKI